MDSIERELNEDQAIRDAVVEIQQLLLSKNEQYGSSAMDPVQIFAKGYPSDAMIRIRLDDKLSRLARGNDSIESDEDIFKDIAGYCILWLAQKKLQRRLGEWS